MKITRSETLAVHLDQCDGCGKEALLYVERNGEHISRDGDCGFERSFTEKTWCNDCRARLLHLEGRDSKPGAMKLAQYWKVAPCVTCSGSGKVAGGRCTVCFGTAKYYGDGHGWQPGLMLDQKPIEDWSKIQHSGIVLHPAEPRAILCTSDLWGFWVPRVGPGELVTELLDGDKAIVWLEVEPGHPFYRVYELTFRGWLPRFAVDTDYGSELMARAEEVPHLAGSVTEALEVTLRVPREILQ